MTVEREAIRDELEERREGPAHAQAHYDWYASERRVPSI
jgi:hypothetical protein